MTTGTRRWSARALLATTALLLAACSSTTTSTPPGTTGPNAVHGDDTLARNPTTRMLPLGAPTAWSTVAASDGRTFLTDADGRALLLRGFNIKTDDPAKDATDELLELGRVRGFDLLRLSIYWDRFEPTRGQQDTAYLDAIGAAIDRAAAHGIYTVLDFHQDVYGAKYGGAGIPAWATNDEGLPFQKQDVWLLNYLQPAVQAAWEHLYEDADIRKAQADAWASIASRFHRKAGLLGYDLLNEPFGKLRTGETVAQAATRIQATQLTEMYQRLTDAIRAVDPDHWILFEPPNVASLGVPVALSKLEGTKLIYYPHFYDATIESATYTPGEQVDGFDPAFFEGYARAIRDYPTQHGYPMLVGEWGIAHPERPGMDAFVAQSLVLMDQLASGWTVFNWCKGEGYCPLDASGQDRPAIGQVVQPYARTIAGSPVSFGFDPASRTMRATFTSAGAKGTTDVVVPASSYPDGWKVTASDASGTWSSTTDTGAAGDAAVVHITTAAAAGPHTVCVVPKASDAPCTAPS